jgi:hypothetical protein
VKIKKGFIPPTQKTTCVRTWLNAIFCFGRDVAKVPRAFSPWGSIVAGLIALLWVAINIGVAKADGGIFVPHDFSGYETGQRAFIYFTGSSETLVISVNFRGNAKDFSWVIPTPAKPEIDQADLDLFKDLEQMTNGGTQSKRLSAGLSGSGAPPSSSVQVIEQKKVGIYDTAVLKATDEQALANWLTTNGYTFPTDKNSELKSYVDNGWYFAIAKIQPDFTDQAKTDMAAMNGTLTPLKLTFPTDKIIYPMKLTGIALRSTLPKTTATTTATLKPGDIPEIVSSDMPIKLYILADHKTQNDSLPTDYAGWISESNRVNLNASLATDQIPAGKEFFLTAMGATIPVAQISEDLIISNANDNEVYPAPANQTSAFWVVNLVALILTPIGFALFPLGLIFILFAILQRFAIKRKWVYILGLVYETLFCLMVVAVSVGFMVVLADFSVLFEESGLLGFAIGVLITLFITVFTTLKMFKRYKKVNRTLN